MLRNGKIDESRPPSIVLVRSLQATDCLLNKRTTISQINH